MPTGQKQINFTSRKLIGKEDLETRFFNYLKESVKESMQALATEDLVINGTLTMVGNGNDAFDIDKSSVNTKLINTDGEVLDPSVSPASTYIDAVSFPNASSTPYYVGFQYAQLPSALAVNPRTGLPEWAEWTDTIGVSGDPDAVADNGDGTLTLTIDTLCGNMDTGNRTAVVFQSTLGESALNISTALETLTIAWDGSNNKITTAGELGQTTVSTTATDYTVIVLGPMIRETAAMKTQDGVVYVGKITGNGPSAVPTAFDYTDQRNAKSLSTVFADGLNLDLFPDTDDTYSLGTPTKRWSEIHVASLNVGTLVPSLHNTYDLGENATRWRDVYISGTVDIAGDVSSDFHPETTDTYDIGTDSIRWRNLYLSGTLGLSGSIAGNLTSDVTDTRDLGTSSVRWKDSYFSGEINSIGTISVIKAAGATSIADCATLTGGQSTGQAGGKGAVITGGQGATGGGLGAEFVGGSGASVSGGKGIDVTGGNGPDGGIGGEFVGGLSSTNITRGVNGVKATGGECTNAYGGTGGYFVGGDGGAGGNGIEAYGFDSSSLYGGIGGIFEGGDSGDTIGGRGMQSLGGNGTAASVDGGIGGYFTGGNANTSGAGGNAIVGAGGDGTTSGGDGVYATGGTRTGGQGGYGGYFIGGAIAADGDDGGYGLYSIGGSVVETTSIPGLGAEIRGGAQNHASSTVSAATGASVYGGDSASSSISSEGGLAVYGQGGESDSSNGGGGGSFLGGQSGTGYTGGRGVYGVGGNASSGGAAGEGVRGSGGDCLADNGNGGVGGNFIGGDGSGTGYGGNGVTALGGYASGVIPGYGVYATGGAGDSGIDARSGGWFKGGGASSGSGDAGEGVICQGGNNTGTGGNGRGLNAIGGGGTGSNGCAVYGVMANGEEGTAIYGQGGDLDDTSPTDGVGVWGVGKNDPGVYGESRGDEPAIKGAKIIGDTTGSGAIAIHGLYSENTSFRAGYAIKGENTTYGKGGWFVGADGFAPLRVSLNSSDPTIVETGDLWYNTTDHQLKIRESGAEYYVQFTAS